MEVGDAFSYGAICTTTDLLFIAVEIISPNDLNTIVSLQSDQAKALRKAIKKAVVQKKGYAFLTVAPDDFRRFLSTWFEYISDLKVEKEIRTDILGDEVVLSEAAD